jgi:hypothetical protein
MLLRFLFSQKLSKVSVSMVIVYVNFSQGCTAFVLPGLNKEEVLFPNSEELSEGLSLFSG